METITMSNFLEMLLEDVKTNKSSKYTISNYEYWLRNDRNTFTIKKLLNDRDKSLTNKKIAALKITPPQANNFDFILDEIKKAFPNQYRLILKYDLYAKELINVVINTVVICLDYVGFEDGKDWLVSTAKELTKPIAFSSFLEILLDAVKNDKRLTYTIYNYDMCIYRHDHEFDGNIFSASGKYDDVIGDFVYLEIPQENKYDFIFEEIKKVFSNQYEIFSVKTLSGTYEILISIKNVHIYLNYASFAGDHWIYCISKELGLINLY